MAFGESISGYSSFDCTLRVPELSLGTLTCWSCWSIILIGDYDIASFFMPHWYICMRYLTCWLCDRLSWLRILIFLCFIAMFVEYIDMLIILIDHLALLSIVILILPWLFCSSHMHGFTGIYHLTWCVDSLACILSWSPFEHDVRITIRLDRHSLCAWVIYPVLCLTACCMIASLCMIACRLSMWVSLLSPYLQLSWFRSFISSQFSLLQVWDLLCACFLIEPEIRSRV